MERLEKQRSEADSRIEELQKKLKDMEEGTKAREQTQKVGTNGHRGSGFLSTQSGFKHVHRVE